MQKGKPMKKNESGNVLTSEQMDAEELLINAVATNDAKRLKRLEKISNKLSFGIEIDFFVPIKFDASILMGFDGTTVLEGTDSNYEIVNNTRTVQEVEAAIVKARNSAAVKNAKKKFAEEAKAFKKEAMEMIKENAKSLKIKDAAVIKSAYYSLFAFPEPE